MRFMRFGPGSESNASNASEVAPRTFDPDTTPDSPASDSDEPNGSNASQSPGLGAHFRCITFISFGPGADSAESTESKVLALGPTSDSLDSLDAFDALDAEAPQGPGGDLDLMSCGGTVDALDSLDSDQGPNLMHLMHRKCHPGLWIQAPPPMRVPLILMHLMDLMHLKSWPEIHSIH